MSSRGRGFSQEWDPMREDFDNSSYDPQYPDDNSSGFVSLDHNRLYITNIPKGLSDEGVFAAFSKYGQIIESFVSSDPARRYGLISFETPGEAKLAMMKLNKTEPLCLTIRVAHKRKPLKEDNNRKQRGSNDREREGRSYREDTASIGSRSNSRRNQDLSNGDNMEDSLDDVAVHNLDSDTKMELEQLRLERLQLQEAQLACRERMLLKQAEKKLSSTSRRVLPTGKIVVCNNDRAESGRENDASFGAGAGDSLKIPALQRVGKCVACGERADAFCGGCGVTPYCSEGCQRRDWQDRHRQVCHNLKRTSAAGPNVVRAQPELEPEPDTPAPAPLRRPRSPEAARERRDDDSGSDRAPPRKFGPPGGSIANAPTIQPAKSGYRNRGMNRSLQDESVKSYDRNDKPNNSYDRGDPPNNSYDRGDRPNNSYERGDKPKKSYDRGDKANNSYDRGDKPNNSYERGNKSNNSYDRNDRPNTSYNREDRKINDRSDDRSKPAQNGYKNFNDRNAGGKRSDDAGRSNDRQEQDEGWNAKSEPKPQGVTPKPTFKPKSPLSQSAEQKHQPKAPEVQETRNEIPLVPKNSVIELLSPNDTLSVSVEAAAASCRERAGLVCLVIPEAQAEAYMRLIDEEFSARQAAGAACRPKPGETFAFFNPEDQAWYRARCVSSNQAALLDAAKLVELTAESQCRQLHADDAAIPEFCCVIEDAEAQLGDKLMGSVVSKSDGVLTLSLSNIESGADAGAVRARRWLPRVDAPAPATPAPATPSTSAANNGAPSIPRPPVTNNSRVAIIDAPRPGRVFVRPATRDAQRAFDEVVTDVAQYGMEATPLKELPQQGQTVVAKFEDGVHYRALCRRVNSKLNKCLLEYIEYGNEAVGFLEDLYPCPPNMDLPARPTLASHVSFELPHDAFTPPAVEYINQLKEKELTLTIPSGSTGGPGAAVRLTTERGEDVTRRIEELCTPEWKKLLDRGGDVLEMECLFYNDIEFVDLPASGGELEIVDMSQIQGGVLSGHARGAGHVARAMDVERQLEEYCNSALCKEPYLPKPDEFCVVRCPTLNKPVRAIFIEQKDGPGGAFADVLCVDYGTLERVPVCAVRKMPPELVRAAPAAACSLDVRDFPREPTDAQLARAQSHMRVNERGRGVLRYTRAAKQEHGDYVVDAPDLIRAMQ